MTQHNPNLTLSSSLLTRIQEKFFEIARPLEKARFNYHFANKSEDPIITALKSYQNYDGGFGHGLEADFHLPNSTPMATSVGLRILSQLPESPKRNAMIRKALAYLKQSFYIDRPGWFAVIPEINEFPHAPWWNFDQTKNQTIIDIRWGNPSAELIAYLWHFRSMIPNWDITPLIEHATHYLEHVSTFTSEHEIYCFLHLFHYSPEEFRVRMKPKLLQAVQSLMVSDENQWNSYVPQPVHFLLYPEDTEGWMDSNILYINLQFLKTKLENEYLITPSWNWGMYPQHWELARNHWTGVLTLRALRLLQQYS